MYKSLKKHWGLEGVPAAVALSPTAASVFHRAKTYGKSHQHRAAQKLYPRVSTAEAAGLLLAQVLLWKNNDNDALSAVAETLQRRIVQAVIANNQALRYASAVPKAAAPTKNLEEPATNE